MDSVLLEKFKEAVEEVMGTDKTSSQTTESVQSKQLCKVYNIWCNEFSRSITKLACINQNEAVDADTGLKIESACCRTKIHIQWFITTFFSVMFTASCVNLLNNNCPCLSLASSSEVPPYRLHSLGHLNVHQQYVWADWTRFQQHCHFFWMDWHGSPDEHSQQILWNHTILLLHVCEARCVDEVHAPKWLYM